MHHLSKKYMNTFDAVGYLAFFGDCLAHIIKNYRFCRLKTRFKHLLKAVTYVT